MKNTRSKIFFILCMLTVGLRAGVHALKFDNLSVDDGLANNTVTTIIKDNKGFMWFGTYEGLCWYDGVVMKVYDKSNSILPHNHIYSLFLDSQNRVWVGTRSGLCVYDSDYQSFEQVELSASDNTIFAINETPKGEVVVCTSDQGLLTYCEQRKQLVQLALPNAHISTIAARHEQNTFYLGVVGKGVVAYNYLTRNVEVVYDGTQKFSCMQCLHDTLWIGNDDGLVMYDTHANKEIKWDAACDIDGSVQFVCQDSKGIMWVGTETQGVFLFDAQDKQVSRLVDSRNPDVLDGVGVYEMYEDEQGIVWIGTMKGGVAKWNPRAEFLTSVSCDDLSSNAVTNFEEIDDVYLWVATDGSGLRSYNRITKKFEQTDELKRLQREVGRAVIALKKDKYQNVWIATYGNGLFCYNLKTRSLTAYNKENSNLLSNTVWSLYVDRQERLWIGCVSGGGLFRFDYDQRKIVRENLPIGDVICISQTDDGKLLLGTYKEMYIYEPQHNRSISYNLDDPIRVLLENSDSSILIGTEGSGFRVLNPQTGVVSKDSMLDVFQHYAIMGAVGYEQDLWISTRKGLFQYDGESGALNLYDRSDGLQSSQFYYSSAFRDSKGNLYFGAINGFTCFSPSDMHFSQENALKLQLTDFYVRNQSVYQMKDKRMIGMLSNQSLRLKHSEAYIRFDFAAISYLNSQKVVYSSMLEGLDVGWNYLGKTRSVSYAGLRPGEYTLKVRYAIQLDLWSDHYLEIPFVVLPPFYQTWWAYVLYVFIILYVFMLVLYTQRKQQRLKHSVELSTLKEQQVKEMQLVKERFFINISHELRTPLMLILNPIKDCLSGSEYVPMGRKELTTVHNNANRLLRLINQLLLFRKIEVGKMQLQVENLDIIQLLDEIHMNLMPLATEKNIEFTYRMSTATCRFISDVDKLEVIFYNLLHNALKYTPANGKVMMTVEVLKKTVKIKIKDTGCGIKEEDLEQIFARFYSSSQYKGIGIGLSLVKNYVELLDGDICVQSKEGMGAEFTVVLPIADAPNEFMHGDVVFPSVVSDSWVDSYDVTTSFEEQEILEASDDEMKTKVLLVEDNKEVMAYMHKMIVETKRYEVFQARNGKEALQMVEKVMPDIVLSDIHMPEMSGIELCSEIKNSLKYSHIYFIMITADVLQETQESGQKSGADEYITKPFDKVQLLNKLATIRKYQSHIIQYYKHKVMLQSDADDFSTANTYFVDLCIGVVKNHYQDVDFTVQTFASLVNMSHSSLYKKLKMCTGKSVNEFVRSVKLSIAAELLLERRLNVTEVAEEIGINDIKYFREIFKKQFGVVPSKYVSI